MTLPSGGASPRRSTSSVTGPTVTSVSASASTAVSASTSRRAELNVLLNRTLDLLPNLRFDPDLPAPHVTGLMFRMPTAVPAVWD